MKGELANVKSGLLNNSDSTQSLSIALSCFVACPEPLAAAPVPCRLLLQPRIFAGPNYTACDRVAGGAGGTGGIRPVGPVKEAGRPPSGG